MKKIVDLGLPFGKTAEKLRANMRTCFIFTETRKTAKTRRQTSSPPPERVTFLLQNRAPFAALRKKDKKSLTPPELAAKLHSKFCPQSQVNNPHSQKLMKNVPSRRVRPTNSQEGRRSLFPFAVSSRCLRFAAARQILSFGIALALLLLSIPDASAQQNPARNPDKDIATSGLGLSNKNARGIWVDEGKQVMLVLDAHGQHKKIFSYCMETKRRLDNHHKDGEATSNPDADDFYLYSDSAGTTQLPNPYGIWSDGSTLWVSNFGQKDPDTKNFDGPKAIKPQIYAYTIMWADSPIDSSKKYAKKGTRVSGQDFNPQTLITAGNEKPHGIWVHSGIMWVADNGADKIFAYNRSTKTHDSSKDIVLTHDDAYAQGIWSDGTTMWVANIAGSDPDDEQIIYAYDITSKARDRDPRKDFTALSAAGNDRPRGIWSDGTTMWVADQTDNKIYAYNSPVSPNIALDFDTTLQNAENDRPRGMWSDGVTMWVADASDKKLYAYHFFTKERLPDKEFNTLEDAGNVHPTGIWSDGTTMWVADYTADKIYAYKMEDRSHDEGKDFNILNPTPGLNDDESEDPIGIWSDGTTMWVADTRDNKVYAYKMSDKTRDSTKDINVKNLLVNLNNLNTQGIWSDGTTMWVADWNKVKIHAFTLPVDVEDENGVKSVRAASRVEAKDLPVLALANKRPRGIWSDETTMWVTDEAVDRSKSKIYAYRLSDAASLGELKITGHIPSPEYEDFDVDLKINDELKPFNSGITRYTASVPYATERLTIAPTTLRTDDVSSISPADTDTTDTKNGHQVNLAVGENTISITVDTPNTDTTSRPQTRTYTVVVTREFFTFNDPSKDILVSTNSIIEGIWANETTLWAVDSETTYTNIVTVGETNQTNLYKKILAYNRATKQRDAGKDINLIPDNFAPLGIWSNGTIMWVADLNPNPNDNKHKLYAYGLAGGARLNSTNDFNLNSANSNPQWIWSDGVTMWVTDDAGTANDPKDDKIFAYNLAAKTRDSSREIDLAGLAKDNNKPRGVWSDGANLWVANNGADNAKIYSYKLAVTEIDCREETKDFNTLEAAGNLQPKAIFSDGATMWVVDNTAKKIFAYNQPLSGNAWLKTLTLSGEVFHGTQPFKLSNPTTHYNAWVDRSTESQLLTTIAAEAQDPNAVSLKISHIQNRTNFSRPFSGHQINGYQISLSAGNNPIRITVTAENGDAKLYAVNIYRIKDDKGIDQLDFDLKIGNELMEERGYEIPPDPTGIWSDGATMWVVDGSDKAVYAYKMSGEEWGQLDADKTFELGLDNTGDGIWSNGTTFWVSGGFGNTNSGSRICAYPMWTTITVTNTVTNNVGVVTTNRIPVDIFANRDPSQDFINPINIGGFSNPKGLWGDDETLWIANTHSTIFAYNLTNRAPVPSKDIKLSASALDIWSNGTTMWVLNDLRGVDDNERKLHAYTLNLSATEATNRVSRDTGKDIAIATSGDPKAIWSNGTVMWVAFADSRNPDILAYPMPTTSSGVTDQSDFYFSEDSTLKALQLSGATLTPAFSADNHYYTALVDHTVHTATVTATSNDSGAAVDIFSGGRGTTRRNASRGPQVALKEGYNIIAIDVTAESRTAQSTYIIEVTKAEAPPISGGPLPQAPSSQASGGFSSASQEALAGSSAGLGEWKSRLIFAEPLQNGGVRFVFLVPAEELKIETTPDLLGETWRPLPDDEFKAVRESNGNGQDQLTVILPQTEGKQRFLRLTPQR